MRQNSKQLVERVRENLFEFQTTVLSNKAILAKINEAYREIYQILIKSYPDVISKTLTFDALGTKVLLPRELKSSRILEVFAECINTYIKLEQISYGDYLRGSLNNTSSGLFRHPVYFAINNGYLYLYPETRSTITLTYVPELINIGQLIGQVASVKSSEIPMYNVTEAIDLLPTERNVVTVSDHETGFIKATYEVEVEDDTLSIVNSKMDRYNGLPINKLEAYSFERVSVSVEGTVSLYGSNNLKVGETVSLELLIEEGEEFFTEYGLSYDSPDYLHSIDWGISGSYTVMHATRTGVLLQPLEPKTVNYVVNQGYMASTIPESPTNWIDFTVTDSGYGYTQITCGLHGLGVTDDVFYVELTGNPYIQARVISDTTIELSFEVTTETQFRLAKVTENIVLQNSFPRLYTAGTDRSPVKLIGLVKNAITELEEIYSIFQDDLISLGASSGTHHLDTSFEKYLVYYATVLIKDSMQEDVGILTRMLDGVLKDVHADIGYRKLNRSMRSETSRYNHSVNYRGRR